MTPLVTAAGVTRSYHSGAGAVPVLKGVDLSIDAGETVMLSGRSGSGKTTLLNIVGGIDRADAGSLNVCGVDLMHADQAQLAEQRRTSISFIFQAFGLLPVLSAAENVEVPLRLLAVPPSERRERVMGMLQAVGLEARAKHRPGELSGGEQQRVAIARALVGRPLLLIADEPTGQLDSTTGRQVMELLEQLGREHDLAMLIASHQTMTSTSATRQVTLSAGRLESAEL